MRAKVLFAIGTLTALMAGDADSQIVGSMHGRMTSYGYTRWENTCSSPSYFTFGRSDAREIARQFERFRACVTDQAENDMRVARQIIARDATEQINESRASAVRAIN